MSSVAIPYIGEAQALDGLTPREIRAAVNVASGMGYGAAFVAAGFPERSAKTRASEYKNRREPKYARFREAVRYLVDKKIAELAGKALSTLERLLDSPHGPTAARAAVELLNRSGFSTEHRLHVEHVHSSARAPDELRRILAEELKVLEPEDRAFFLKQLSAADHRAVEGAVDAAFEPVDGEGKGE